MTRAERERLRELVAKATPGWIDDNGYRVLAGDKCIVETKYSDANEADHALIAAAPAAISALLDALERADAALDAAEDLTRELASRVRHRTSHRTRCGISGRCSCGLDELLARVPRAARDKARRA